jgi:hypothetical protein
MKPFVISMLFAAAGLTAAAGQAWADPGPGYVWGPDYAAIVSHVGAVLDAIDSPARKSALAEQWLDFSKQIIAKSLDQRRAWLNLQEQQLQLQQQAEQSNVDLANLQLQIEQLRAQNLKLENENLQLRQQLQGQSAEAQPQSPAAVPPSTETPAK